jgi:hypothetical protein
MKIKQIHLKYLFNTCKEEQDKQQEFPYGLLRTLKRNVPHGYPTSEMDSGHVMTE